jgi:hypothetical protein
MVSFSALPENRLNPAMRDIGVIRDIGDIGGIRDMADIGDIGDIGDTLDNTHCTLT